MAFCTQKLDGFKRFGPCYPHVKISLKFEVLGPRNGRGRTSPKPLKFKVVLLGSPVRRPTRPYALFAVGESYVSRSPLVCLVVTLLQLVAQGGYGVGELDVPSSDAVMPALDYLLLFCILLECLLQFLLGFFG